MKKYSSEKGNIAIRALLSLPKKIKNIDKTVAEILRKIKLNKLKPKSSVKIMQINSLNNLRVLLFL